MDVQVERRRIEVDRQAVLATRISPPVRLPGILFVHGWGGSQRHDLVRAREIAALGCVCVTFDLRGHEHPPLDRDRVSREHNLRDLGVVHDWLCQDFRVDTEQIAVVGISYGGYLAALLTSLRPVRWLALRSPALYKDAGWNRPKQALHEDPDLMPFRHRRVSPAANRALAACARFRGDVLLVGAENDEIVPSPVMSNYQRAFSQARTLTTRLLTGADHALSDRRDQQAYTAILIRWLSEQILSRRSNSARRALARPDLS